MNGHVITNAIICQFSYKDWNSNYKKSLQKVYNPVHINADTFVRVLSEKIALNTVRDSSADMAYLC